MSRICRFCGRAYEPESFEDKNLDMGGWTTRYSEWAGSYCLPCVESWAKLEAERYREYHNTCGPCPWCGKRWGCSCAVFYGGATQEIQKEVKE